jgi:hypothetical protein
MTVDTAGHQWEAQHRAPQAGIRDFRHERCQHGIVEALE